jgi:hypothetical protein
VVCGMWYVVYNIRYQVSGIKMIVGKVLSLLS